MTQPVVKIRPIPFRDSMVRAILDGRKIQTRRLVKDVNQYATEMRMRKTAERFPGATRRELAVLPETIWTSHGPIDLRKPLDDPRNFCEYSWHKSPHGLPGERLWVREAYQDGSTDRTWWYRANLNEEQIRFCKRNGFKWKPATFMPRCASRILVEISWVRVERLQTITDQAAIMEGVEGLGSMYPAEVFRILWESIYGRESWMANPWVWVYTFSIHHSHDSTSCLAPS